MMRAKIRDATQDDDDGDRDGGGRRKRDMGTILRWRSMRHETMAMEMMTMIKMIVRLLGLQVQTTTTKQWIRLRDMREVVIEAIEVINGVSAAATRTDEDPAILGLAVGRRRKESAAKKNLEEPN